MSQLREIWAVAALDLRLWSRRPLGIVSALLPPLGMALLLVVLSLAVTQEPVALVVQAHGPEAVKMRQIIEGDTDAYFLTVTDPATAAQMLADQRIAAVITIPPDFDTAVMTHTARVHLTLNNVDIDFADDIRRSVDRSVGSFDSLPLNIDSDEDPAHPDNDGPPPGTVPVTGTAINPYHIAIDEHDLRQTNVPFLNYQVVPVLVLLVLNIGLLGTALRCAEDDERGMARLLALAPLPAWTVSAGRLLGGLLAALAMLLPAVLLCAALGVISPPPGHWLPLAALLTATALFASGLGAMLGTLLRGPRVIALAASIFTTYLFFLGGGFTTIAFLPAWLRLVSAFNPARYAIDGLRQTLFYSDLAGFGTDLAVLTGAALVSAALGAIAVRR